MATINPGDESFSLIKETVPGTTPATGALLKFDHVPGTSLELTSDFLESPILAAKRASGGSRKTGYRVENGLKSQLSRNPATELLMTSALSSGAWVETGAVGDTQDVIKGGETDTFVTVEKKMSASLFQRFRGVIVSKMAIAIDASGIADLSFDFLGMARDTATTASALTYSPDSGKLKLTGTDVATVTIGGMSGVSYRKLELNVETAREVMDKFGSTSAFGIGSGARKVTGSVTFYREDFAPETALAGDAAVPITFTVGSGADGFTFTIPAANCSVPKDEADGAKALVTVQFSAKYDATLGTDIQITRL